MALINAKAFLFSFSGLFRLECFIFASFEAIYYPHLSEENVSHTDSETKYCNNRHTGDAQTCL